MPAAQPETTGHVTTNPLRRWGDTLPLSGVLLAAFALRIWLLGDQNLWWDEGLAIWAVRQSPLQMTLWTASDVHPPLYFWLLQMFVRLGGVSSAPCSQTWVALFGALRLLRRLPAWWLRGLGLSPRASKRSRSSGRISWPF